MSFHTVGATPPAVVRLTQKATEFPDGNRWARMRSLVATSSITGHLSERASVSLARATKRYVPAVRGVPTIDPSASTRNPMGSLPATSSQSKMPDPPRARRVIRNGIPTSDPGATAGVEVIQGCTRILSVNCFCVRFPRSCSGHPEARASPRRTGSPGLQRSASQRPVLCKGSPAAAGLSRDGTSASGPQPLPSLSTNLIEYGIPTVPGGHVLVLAAGVRHGSSAIPPAGAPDAPASAATTATNGAIRLTLACSGRLRSALPSRKNRPPRPRERLPIRLEPNVGATAL